MNRIHSRSIIAATFALSTAAALLFAGPLNPPAGPITSTYKTLTEVEPRIAINLTNTPGDADSLFKITQPGSYYLTGNITGVAAKHGIEIAVAASGPSVTIDLMGFQLAGVPGSLDGVSVTNLARNTAVRNGTARAWGGDGVDVVNSTNNLLEDLRVDGNAERGISAGNASTVTGCTARSNTGIGIVTGTGSTLTGCTASTNTGTGIFANSRSTVTGCTAIFNTGDGIEVNGDCRVTDNTCASNGNGGDGAGIHATGNDNRIEANNCTDNDRGIDVDLAGNIIIKNTCSGNTINWTIAIGNSFGPIVVAGSNIVAVSANGAVAGNLGTTDPNANFSY